MLDLAEEFIVQRCHAVVVGHSGEKVHQDQLRVALASVAGLGLFVLLFVTALDNQDRGHTAVLPPEIACIDLGSVVLLGSRCDGNVGLRGGIGIKGRVELHKTGADIWCRAIVSRSCNDAVADDEEQFLVVRVLGRRQ